MRKLLITAGSVFVLSLGFVPMAYADSYVGPVYKSQSECNHDAIQRTAADGGAYSGHNYYCKEVHHVDNGVAGCQPKTQYAHDGCIGNWWELWRTIQD